MKKEVISAKTLEEAIAFTEEKIDNSRSFDEILIAYKEHYCGKSK